MRFDLSEVVLVLLAGISIGAFLIGLAVSDDVSNNTLNGYHCQPITTHNTLEDAKAKVIEYQKRVK